jgi:hypothetical protein
MPCQLEEENDGNVVTHNWIEFRNLLLLLPIAVFPRQKRTARQKL